MSDGSSGRPKLPLREVVRWAKSNRKNRYLKRSIRRTELERAMAFEREKAKVDFETMLKRHLVRRHRSAMPCTKFDPELASAYLEDVLGRTARDEYESHLAACLDCTDAVVQLHQLAPEAIPQVVSARPGWVGELWESARGGLSFAPWKWGFAAAGAAAVLIVGFSVMQRTRLSQSPATSVSSRETVSGGVAGNSAYDSPRAATPAGSPSPFSDAPLIAPSPTRGDQREVALQRSATATKSEAAAPPANAISGTVRSVGGVVVPQADVVLVDGLSQQARASTRTDSQGQFNFQGIPGGKYSLQIQAPGFAPQQLSDVRPVPGPELQVRLDAVSPTQNQVAQLPSPPAVAQVQSELSKEELDRQRRLATAAPATQTPPPLPAPARSQTADSDAALRLAPSERAKAKQMKAPKANTEDENFKPLQRTVRGKTFRFDRGIWIDVDYKPQNRLPRTKLTRDSAEFERAQSEIPALTPFFDLVQVIVVWQGRVYEVRK